MPIPWNSTAEDVRVHKTKKCGSAIASNRQLGRRPIAPPERAGAPPALEYRPTKRDRLSDKDARKNKD
jgi:hypothetical protein